MISEQARTSFERSFRHALRTRLPACMDATCEIDEHALPETPARDMGRRDDVMVLTISSIAFRLLILLQFGDDSATREHYGAADGARTLDDALMEVGNLCCGALNQQLVEHFPDLGMSTPYRLDGNCLAHLGQLKPDCLVSYRIRIDARVTIGATLCVCARAPTDFDAQISETVDEAVGELELF